MAAQAEPQGAHGRQAGIAADDAGRPKQQHAHTGAERDGQHRAGQAQAWGEHGADLQHHQADAEGEPQCKQVAKAEDALAGGDRVVRGEMAGGCHCHVRRKEEESHTPSGGSGLAPRRRRACQSRWPS
ncbi:hypothetical protein D3C79_884950 [compost metagenome]